MNKEILISNTKLKIVSYPVPAGKKFRLPNKSGMKYQFVITVDKNLEVHYHNTEKVYEVNGICCEYEFDFIRNSSCAICSCKIY